MKQDIWGGFGKEMGFLDDDRKHRENLRRFTVIARLTRGRDASVVGYAAAMQVELPQWFGGCSSIDA